MPIVVPPGELLGVAVHVLGAHLVVNLDEAPVQHGEEAFGRVGVHVLVPVFHILARRMVHVLVVRLPL